MNQNAKCVRLRLRDLTASDRPYGNEEGREVFRELTALADARPEPTIFEVSFDGIVGTDASFARESVISAAKLYRGHHSFCLSNLDNRDVVDNWRYAAHAKDQPLVIWHTDGRFEVIGPAMTAAASDLLTYVLRSGEVGTGQVAADLGISVPNASTRLKKLVSDGYLLRREDVADSGGVEFTYLPIRCAN